MNGYEDLNASRYLADAYAKAESDHRSYLETGDPRALLAGAQTLCETMGRLRGDDQFWGALIDAIIDAEREGDALRDFLHEFRQMAGHEEQLLIDLGLAPEQASGLMSDVFNAMDIAGELPDGRSLENLRSRMDDLGDAVCEVAGSTEQELKRQRRRKLRIFRRGLKFIGGAVTVVADGVAAQAGVLPTLASISTGVELMVDAAFPEGGEE